ncbi:hypothetical protein E2P65_01300 [Candidatus Bathyarchaeota archaeon]|nr:hypothetical protein E2P65_01300 [Candidatus Bathyarchaeota archaeon]
MPSLMAYLYVPPGFEMVLSEEDGAIMLSPGSGGGCWGLWFNVSLSDDPASWDDEILRLNRLQVTLPPLSDDQRLVRSHMAELCKYHPLFPGSVEKIIGNVGAGKPLDASYVGCEGRGLLRTLGVQTEKQQAEQGRSVALNTSRALRKALRGDKPVSSLERKYYLLVKRMDSGSRGTVSWLADVLARGEPETKSFRELCSVHDRRAYKDARPMERPLHCFRCEQGSGPCCFSQQTDATLLCLSGMEAREAGKLFRRFSEEYVLAYCDALNSWLADLPTVNPWTDIEALYVGEEEAQAIAEKTAEALGEKTPLKVWLAGCLLKTLKSNQRWHCNEELLDDVPGAVSWLE